MNVGLTGRYATEVDKAILHGVQKIIERSNMSLNVINNPELVDSIEQEHSLTLYDDIFEESLDNVDKSDVILIVTPPKDSLGYDLVGGVIGYCWSLGKPVILLSLEEISMSKLITRAVHAHLHSLEELMDYDFINLPIKAYGGSFVTERLNGMYSSESTGGYTEFLNQLPVN